MVGQPQPLDQKFPLVKSDGTPTDYFIRWAQQRQSDIADGITAEQADELISQAIADWSAARHINAGLALDGGGPLSADVTIDHAESLVVPGTYGSATKVPRIVVDQEGHIQGVTEVAISGGGGGGAPAIVQSAVLCNSNSVGSVTFAAAPAAGNMLIAVGARWTVAVATNAGWTRLYDEGSQTDDCSIIFYKVCAAGESAVQQFSSTVSGWEMAVYEVSGAAPSSIMNYGGDSTIASSTLVSINLGVPKANCLGLGMFASQLRAAPTFVIAGTTADATATDASATNGGPRKMQGFHSTAALAVGAWQPTCTYGSAGINGWTAIILASA